MLRTYADAVLHEAEVKPIRGTDTKPIGVRRNKHMNMRREGEDIVCRLYQTDVVTYKPDGKIVIKLDGYTSDTTCGFISDLLGPAFYIFDHRVWCRVKDGEFPLNNHGENVFVRGENKWLRFTNPAPNIVHKVNRAVANKVRKQYAGFKKYLEGMCKLRKCDKHLVAVSTQEVEDVFGVKRPESLYFGRDYGMKDKTKQEVLRLLKSTEAADQYKVFLWLCVGIRTFMHWEYVHQYEVIKKFDDLIMYLHRDEVFNAEEVQGVQKRDPYGKFFDNR